MGDRIDVDYEILKSFGKRFETEAETVRQLLAETRAKTQALRSSGWIGRGSDAFFAEMNNRVLPGMNRLANALQEAGGASRKISDTFRQAEEEASGFIKQDEAAGSSTGRAAVGSARFAESLPDDNRQGAAGYGAPELGSYTKFANTNTMWGNSANAGDAGVGSSGGPGLDGKGGGVINPQGGAAGSVISTLQDDLTLQNNMQSESNIHSVLSNITQQTEETRENIINNLK